MQQDFWNQIDWASLAQKAVFAIAILVITWIVAKLVKTAFAKLAGKVKALQRAGTDGHTLGESLGSVAALLIWLFGLVAILQLFGLSQVLAPIQGLLSGITNFLPNLIGAAFVFVVGALIAKIVRQIIETSLSAMPFERWFSSANSKVGQATGTSGATAGGAAYDSGTTTQAYDPNDPDAGATGGASAGSSVASTLPKTVATVVYALIMIVVTIAALQILGIESISDPAEQMLQMIFAAIPNIIAASILLGIGVLIARFAGDILQSILDGFGTDRALREVDVLPADKSATPTIAKVVQVAIVLFFAVAAADLLGFPQITNFLSEVLELGGRVLFGGAIIAAGFFIANLLAKMVSGTGSTVVRYATIVLFAAMGLSYMGIADSVIQLAFGALVIGGAAAAALAFGLGGRDAAARQLEQMRQQRSGGTSSAGSHSATPPTGGGL